MDRKKFLVVFLIMEDLCVEEIRSPSKQGSKTLHILHNEQGLAQSTVKTGGSTVAPSD